ncbi:CHASE2 domain-containing protein [Variovorax sp. LARHSF232]
MSFHHPPENLQQAASPHCRWQGLARRRGAWLALALGLIALVSWLTIPQRLPRVDRILQESALNLMRPAAADNIVIVAIDDRSLEAIGRWPWRRALHAEVLRQISRGGAPRCIGLDLLLDGNSAQHPDDDTLLAKRIKEAGCVVLPMALQVSGRHAMFQSEALPAPELAQAATALGHAHLSVDGDGVAEGVYLHEGFAGREWPQFSLAMQQAANDLRAPQPSINDGPQTSPPGARWQRHHPELLLYTAPTAPFFTVSYVDVLRGKVAPEVFRNRYVLIGATAESLADLFASPAPTPNGLVPGVEIFATVLQALDGGVHIHAASAWQDLAFNLAPLVVVLLGLLWLGPLGVFALIVSMLLARTGLQMAQPWLGLRFSAAPGLIGLLLVYPLWSLARLTAAYRFLQRGTRELNTVLDGMSMPHGAAQDGDFLDREIDATATAVQRVRDMHRFVRDGVDHLPDATLVLDRHGRVYLANRAAARHWQREAWTLVDCDAHELLKDVRSRNTGQPMIHAGALDSEHPVPITGEGEDASCCCAACPFSIPAMPTRVGWWRW